MTQGERIREVRKSLGLTLEKFGEKIGMKKNSVSQIENGKNSVTEQVVKAICREYNVDYIWLTTGDGDMFVETDDDFIERIDRIMLGEDDARKNLFKALLDASDEDIAAFQRIIDLFASKKDSQPFNCQSHGCIGTKRIYISFLGFVRYVSSRLFQ